MNLKAASITSLELRKWEGADTAIAFKAECIFQMGVSEVEGTAFVVEDGYFFPCLDIMNCVNGFTLCIAVPIIVSIWKTAVIYEANDRIDAISHRVEITEQSIDFDNITEQMFAREIVMKQKKLLLLSLW